MPTVLYMATAKTKQTAKKTNLTPDVVAVVDKFDSAWQYQKTNYHNRWERNWKLYNNIRTNVGYQGTTNTFVPITFSVVETITAALANGRPNIQFEPQDMYSYIATYLKTGQKPDMRPLNAMFDYYWDCDSWDLKSIKTVRNGFIYGTSAEYIWWDVDKPRVGNISPRDLIVDPTLSDPTMLMTNPDDYFAGRRYMTTVDDLKAVEVVDPDTGKMSPRFNNLDKVHGLNSTASGDLTEKEVKDILLGSVYDDDDDQVEVLELYIDGRIKSVANRKVLIEDQENKLGIVPIVIHRFIADESLIYGKAIVDVIAATQELLNDTKNQRSDSVTDALNQQWELDPKYASWINKVKNAPGTVYPFTPGSLQPLPHGTIPQGAFEETSELKMEIREATAADQVIMGVNTPWRTTATEIKAQLAQAGQRFDLYVMMLEKEAFYQRSKIVYKMMRKYLKGPQLVPTGTIDGPKFFVFNPDNYDDTYEPKIELKATVDSQKQQQTQQASQAYQILIADPTNNLWQAKKILYPKMFDLSEEELDKIIGSQAPVGAQGMPGGPGATGMPGADQMAGVTPPGGPPDMSAMIPGSDMGAPQ